MRTKGQKKRRGKARAWIRRRSSKGCNNNIGKELLIEDTEVYKGMLRMNHGNFWIRWALRVHGLNTLSVAVQMYFDFKLLSHTWMTAKQRKCWAVLSEKFDHFKFDSIRLNTAQHLPTGCSNALNVLRARIVDKFSAFVRGFRDLPLFYDVRYRRF